MILTGAHQGRFNGVDLRLSIRPTAASAEERRKGWSAEAEELAPCFANLLALHHHQFALAFRRIQGVCRSVEAGQANGGVRHGATFGKIAQER